MSGNIFDAAANWAQRAGSTASWLAPKASAAAPAAPAPQKAAKAIDRAAAWARENVGIPGQPLSRSAAASSGRAVTQAETGNPDPVNVSTLKVPHGETLLNIDLDVPFVSQWRLKRPAGACLRACMQMVGNSGYEPGRAFRLMDLSKKTVTPSRAKVEQAVDLIISELKAGRPVIAGVYRGDGKRPNASSGDNITQHFVVIDGVKSDGLGGYVFSTIDPGTEHSGKAHGWLSAKAGATTIGGPRSYQSKKSGPARYTVTQIRTR